MERDWNDKTILIVEDDKFNSLIIKNFLSKTKAKLITAFNGEQAVELAREHKPDIILMDIKLPGISGHEATRKIKEFLPNAIIIAQTAFVTDADRNEALESGCSDFLTKPLSSDKIINAIEKFM
ncbi:response regulator [Tenuifilum thalassicum]|uniref:Response regulator n=1 Tax=Tenuifilum thalassicum TaxID=2590900 RepID=A0A7D4CR72_9BACT|nr:response regulator [Tenuifilum thalassicum]QKG79945.1 response regulator [Tenuifilum thalassicum]